MSRVATACLALALLSACKAEEKSHRAPPPPPPPAAVYAVNKAHEILASHRISTVGLHSTAWAGHWVGNMEISGAMTGTMSTDMTVTQDDKRIIRGVQSAMGVTITMVLAPSPDQPGLAAGIQYDSHALPNGGTFSFHHEYAAVLSGDDLTIGDYSETDDPGSYNGTPIPKAPPQTSLFKLHRVSP